MDPKKAKELLSKAKAQLKVLHNKKVSDWEKTELLKQQAQEALQGTLDNINSKIKTLPFKTLPEAMTYEAPEPVSQPTGVWKVYDIPNGPSMVQLTFTVSPSGTFTEGPSGKSMSVENFIPTQEEQEVASTKKKKKVKKPEPIFQWTFHSSKEVSGTRAVYSTLLREDKSLSCNCPGWVFFNKKKNPNGRSCKHTKQAALEATSVYNKWKKGEKLPELSLADPKYSELPGAFKPIVKNGRVLQLD